MTLPADTPEGLAKAIHAGQNCDSLEDYLTAFDVTLAVLQTEEALYRVAYELAIDCAAENVRYLEVRYSPVLHTRRGLKPTAIVDAVLEGLRAREAGDRHQVQRHHLRHPAHRSDDLGPAGRAGGRLQEQGRRRVRPRRRGGGEPAAPPPGRAPSSSSTTTSTSPSTPARPTAPSRSRRRSTSAARTGSATACGCARTATCSTTSTTTGSRWRCARRPTSRPARSPTCKSHPLKFYFDFGLRVTVNTDNRLITDTTVTKELMIAHRELGFTLDDLTHRDRPGLQERLPAVPREGGPARRR